MTTTEQEDTESAPRERKGPDGTVVAMRVVRAVLKAWPILVAASLLGAGLAMAFSKGMTPVYEAVSTIEFDPQVVRPLTGACTMRPSRPRKFSVKPGPV